MKTLLFTALAAAALVSCSGDTDSDRPANTGGQGSGGQATSGGSGGQTTSGGTSAGGVSGSGGGVPDASLGGTGGVVTDAGACTEGGGPDASAESAIAGSCSVAVLKVTQIDGECSGAGGEHITFDVLEIGRGPAVTKISAGGHAYYPPAGGPSAVGQIFVAGIDPFGKLVARPDNPGWCITGLPSVDGSAHSLLLVKDAVAGSSKMKQILGP